MRLMREYFSTTPDPERGWALAALTGELGFPEAKPSQVRDLVMARVDQELFGWSWDFVGDLAETAALIWPEKASDLGFRREPCLASCSLAREEIARSGEHEAASQRTVSEESAAAGKAGSLPHLHRRVGSGAGASEVPTL